MAERFQKTPEAGTNPQIIKLIKDLDDLLTRERDDADLPDGNQFGDKTKRVSAGGLLDYLAERQSSRSFKDQDLENQAAAIFQEVGETYGAAREADVEVRNAKTLIEYSDSLNELIS